MKGTPNETNRLAIYGRVVDEKFSTLINCCRVSMKEQNTSHAFFKSVSDELT